MTRMDENIERLISRQLDGALGDEEQLELNRELIRNPDAHQLMDDYQRIDSMVASVLQDRFASTDVELPKAVRPAVQPSMVGRMVRAKWHAWWLAPGAAVAAMLAIALARFATTDDASLASREALPAQVTPTRVDVPTMLAGFGKNDQPRIDRKTNKEYFSVVGDDGKVYWFEVDRIREFRRPSPATSAQLISGGF